MMPDAPVFGDKVLIASAVSAASDPYALPPSPPSNQRGTGTCAGDGAHDGPGAGRSGGVDAHGSAAPGAACAVVPAAARASKA